MNSAGRMYLVVSLIVLACVSLTGSVLWRVTGHERPATSLPAFDAVHLPSVCAEFYKDGTNKWKDCMGVGYVE